MLANTVHRLSSGYRISPNKWMVCMKMRSYIFGCTSRTAVKFITMLLYTFNKYGCKIETA